MQGSFPVMTHTVQATGTIAKETFVTVAGAQATANGPALGVTRIAAVAGDQMPVDCLGSAIVTAGAAIAVGAAVQVGTGGKAITRTSTNTIVGTALSAAAADGDSIEVLLIPNAV